MKTLNLYTIAKIAAAAVLFLLAGCDKNKDPDAEPLLRISPASERIAFGAEPTESYTFTVTTNQSEWAVRSDQDWCEVAPDAEAGTFTVTALPNEQPTPPATATITVTAGKAAPITITATQAAGAPEPVLSITPESETITFSAVPVESYAFEVSTNQAEWTVSSDQDWCKVAPDAEAGTFTVTALPNDLPTAPPAATITVSAGEAAPITITATQAEVRYDVYVLGSLGLTNGKDQYCYWKNGELVLLPIPGAPDGVDRGNVYEISVDNGTVYMSGYYDDGDNWNFGYWKEGEEFVKFPGVGPRDFVETLSVVNGSFYYAGQIRIDYVNVACYWKDGVPTPMSPEWNGEVMHMVVSEGRPYMAGVYWSGAPNYACMWSDDGTFTPLGKPEDGHSSWARGIALSRGRVCVLGEERHNENNLPLWIDGTEHVFQFPADARSPVSIAICSTPDEGFLILGWFVRGSDGARCACLWDEQGNRTELVDYYSVAEIVAVDGSVYIGGKTAGRKPCYWKDGKRTDLPVTADTDNAEIKNICVVKR